MTPITYIHSWGRLKMKGDSSNRLRSSISCNLFLTKFLWGLLMWHKMITKSQIFNNRYFSFMTCIHCGSAISLPLVQRAFSLDSVWWSSICRKYCLSLWQREKRTCTGSETFSRKWFIPSTHISLANAGHREMPTLYSAGLCRPASYRQQVHREKHWT